jgi:uncharacterized protein
MRTSTRSFIILIGSFSAGGTAADGTVWLVAIETVLVETLDGLLLAGQLTVPRDAVGAAVVCHPHPRFGGDMHNAVVDALFQALPAVGVATLRFDFRGVGTSEGEHDDGVGERVDAAAAIDLVAPFARNGPIVLCGYSFGAMVALDVVHPVLAAWCAVAAPLAHGGTRLAGPDHRPKLLVVPEHDQFTSVEEAGEVSGGWRSVTMTTVPMADHFLAGATGRVAADVAAFVTSLV